MWLHTDTFDLDESNGRIAEANVFIVVAFIVGSSGRCLGVLAQHEGAEHIECSCIQVMIELPLFSHFGCSAGGQLGSPADSWDKSFCRPGIEHSGLQKHSLLLPLLSMVEEAIVGSAIGIGLHERRIAFLECGSDRPEILDESQFAGDKQAGRPFRMTMTFRLSSARC